MHLLSSRPAATVVFGDVNSTIACALAAVKVGVPVVHVEAGLRSFDRSMPEEINRLLVDAIGELLLVSEGSGVENLRREGVPVERISLVGHVMIDTLVSTLGSLDGSLLTEIGLEPGCYGLITLHRPSNVDDQHALERTLRLLGELATGARPWRLPVYRAQGRWLNRPGLGRTPDGTPGATLPPTCSATAITCPSCGAHESS